MIIPFGQWKPDLPELAVDEVGRLLKANNIIPQPGRYDPAREDAELTDDACNGEVLGIGYGVTSIGTVYNYYGTVDKIYDFQGITLREAGTDYDTTGRRWRFERWQERIFATNGFDQIQEATVGGDFADISGATVPGPCDHLSSVSNFLVAGAVDGIGHKLRWSAFNNPNDWATDPLVTQSDSQLLEDGETITGLTSGTWGLIFTRTKIYRLDYVGPPQVFRITRISNVIGCSAPESIVQFGGLTAFYSDGGFYVTDGRGTPRSVSEDLDTFIVETLNWPVIDKVQGAVDNELEVVYWIYPTVGNSRPNRALAWCFSSGDNVRRWSTFDVDLEAIAFTLSPSVGVNDMDNNPFAMDEVKKNMDASQFQAQKAVVMGVNYDHKPATLTGPKLSPDILTAEYPLLQDVRANLRRMRIYGQGVGEDLTVRVGTRRAQNSPNVRWTGVKNITSTGDYTPRASGWYHRFQVQGEGNFTNLQGIKLLEVRNGGKR